MNEVKSLFEILASLAIIFSNLVGGIKIIREMKKSKRRKKRRK